MTAESSSVLQDPNSTSPSAKGGTAMEAGESQRRVKVFLVEDHVLFRTQVARLIARDPRIFVCGESDNALEALEMIAKAQPDLVIVDITLKGMNGLDLIRELKSRAPRALVLVLSMHDESMYAERALRAGASGYVSKQQTSAQLRDAIDRVLSGEVYLSAHMTTELLRKLSMKQVEPASKGLGSLSPREREIFRLMGKGLSTRDIAHELQLGEKTVHSHRFQIKAKLGIKHSAELYSLAARVAEDPDDASQVGIATGPNMRQNEGARD